MYKVIVVGTDGSDRATVAVREALELARMTGGEAARGPGGPPWGNGAGFSDTAQRRAARDRRSCGSKTERTDAQVTVGRGGATRRVRRGAHSRRGRGGRARSASLRLSAPTCSSIGQPRDERSEAARCSGASPTRSPIAAPAASSSLTPNPAERPWSRAKHGGERRPRAVERPVQCRGP